MPPRVLLCCLVVQLRLAIGDSFTDPYLKELEKRIRALYKNLEGHPAHTIDLVFWSDLVGEEVLPSLQQAKSRWLSFLCPVEKILKSYISVLCHLLYQYRFHSSVQWVFFGLATWEARITLAGIADILQICWATKNALENAPSLTAVQHTAAALRAQLSSYCSKNSILASAMSGEVDLPGGSTHAEQVCEMYRRDKGKKLHLQYTAKENVLDEWITIKDIPSPEKMREIFRRLKDFADSCSEKVLSRFEGQALWKHTHIFDVSYEMEQESLQGALWEMANFLNLPTEQTIDEMRVAFALRDAILLREKHQCAESLWSSVLQAVQKRQGIPLAENLVSAFLLAPSQAASCERAFASVTRVKAQLVNDCPTSTLEQYLLLSHGEPLDTVLQNGFLQQCASKWMTSKSRQCSGEGREALGFYRKGRVVISRKRAKRKDSGTKRNTYKKRKKHAGLREQPNARHLERGAGERVDLEKAPDEVEEHDIWIQMSPLKSKKSKTQS